MVDSILLVMAGAVYCNPTGKRYPKRLNLLFKNKGLLLILFGC